MDDTAFYPIFEGEGGSSLQKDLDKLSVRKDDSDIEVSKLPFGQSSGVGEGLQKPFKTMYNIHGLVLGQFLETPTSAGYLKGGVFNNLSWDFHTDKITANANRPLSFIERNIKPKMPRVNEWVLNSLIRSQLDHGELEWYPLYQNIK